MKQALFLLVILMNVTSCKNTEKKAETTDSSTILKVFAVNYPLSFFTSQIGGEFVEIVYAMPNDVDPAYWSPEQVLAEIQTCDLIFANGAGYAKWMAKVSLPSSKVVNTSEANADKYIPMATSVTHSHGGSGEHVHADYASTTWIDFKIALGQAESIKDALVKKMPSQAELFATNFEKLKSELTSLDVAMVKIGDNLKGQILFTSHPVYQYLGQAYGIAIVSVHWEPGEDPIASQWDEFLHELDHNPSKLMLWEGQPSIATGKKLTELNIATVVFSPCANKPAEGDFISVMEENISAFKDAVETSE